MVLIVVSSGEKIVELFKVASPVRLGGWWPPQPLPTHSTKWKGPIGCEPQLGPRRRPYSEWTLGRQLLIWSSRRRNSKRRSRDIPERRHCIHGSRRGVERWKNGGMGGSERFGLRNTMEITTKEVEECLCNSMSLLRVELAIRDERSTHSRV